MYFYVRIRDNFHSFTPDHQNKDDEIKSVLYSASGLHIESVKKLKNEGMFTGTGCQYEAKLLKINDNGSHKKAIADINKCLACYGANTYKVSAYKDEFGSWKQLTNSFSMDIVNDLDNQPHDPSSPRQSLGFEYEATTSNGKSYSLWNNHQNTINKSNSASRFGIYNNFPSIPKPPGLRDEFNRDTQFQSGPKKSCG